MRFLPSSKMKYFLALMLVFFVFLALIFFYLRTPLFFNHLASILEYKYGFKISAAALSYAPVLKTKISNLQIVDTEEIKLNFISKEVKVESTLFSAIKGEVEKIVLQGPKIQLKINGKEDAEGDLSFIKKIPPVHLLTIRNGELELAFEDGLYELAFNDINIDVQNFSPENGGNATFNGCFNIKSRENPGLTGNGQYKGSMKLTSFFPNPVGKGLLEISLKAGLFNKVSLTNTKLYLTIIFTKQGISISPVNISAESLILKSIDRGKSIIRKPTLKASMIYELKTKKLIVDNFLCDMPSIGTFNANFRGIMEDTFPWKANMEANEIDFKTLFSLLKPFIDKSDNDQLFIGGTGNLKSEMEGSFKGKNPMLSGKVNFRFLKGEFSSKDGTKAGQGAEGSIILKFNIPLENKKSDVKIDAELFPGEFLYGKYYKDFSKDNMKISFIANLSSIGKKKFDYNGTLNLFDTGYYLYTGSINENKWKFNFKGKDICSEKIISLILQDYLQQNYQALNMMKITGKLQAIVNLKGEHNKYSFSGFVKVDNLSANIPEKSLKVSNVAIQLPFSFSYPSGYNTSEKHVSPGKIYISRLQKGLLEITDLSIPVIAWDNVLAISDIFEIPFYEGRLSILQCKAMDILSTSRKFHFTAKIEDLNVGAMLHELTGIELPGIMEADFPMVAYEDGAWVTRGITKLKVFGGIIQADNVYAKNIFSSSRTMGGDILFSDIDLGMITDTIKIGKIKGVIKGSLKDLEFEYGQPSHFTLDIDSIRKKGVEQTISVDAIENISIIGTGSGAVGAILKTGINSFFKEYPYSKIGIRCNLQHDNFRFNGKIHKGGKEYFIRKGFFRGIDVINRDPDNIISFNDMQERIGRIFQKNGKKPTVNTGVN